MADKNSEKKRLRENGAAWKQWGRICPNGSGARCARTTARTATPGTTFRTIMRAAAPIAGARTASPAFSDAEQRLCLSLALWNGRDPILKERLFGLTNSEGNHGEDVKELYYYLDATPTHSYLKMLYKYPQAAFPYADLVDENRRRGIGGAEYELLDTGVFDDDRYFDVFVEYAQADPDDMLVRIVVHNRGDVDAPDPSAAAAVVPQHLELETWRGRTCTATDRQFGDRRPSILRSAASICTRMTRPSTPRCRGALFCDNETNARRSVERRITSRILQGRHSTIVSSATTSQRSTRSSTAPRPPLWYERMVPAGGTTEIRLRLTRAAQPHAVPRLRQDLRGAHRRGRRVLRRSPARHRPAPTRDSVQRQAFAGMIWSKQFFYYDVPEWLNGDPTQPAPPAGRKTGRNRDWAHLNNADIISMPDKWEYPWYAAWDLAFHTIPLAQLDPEFAKEQLMLLTREWYMHPNGQMPAYEWAFGDVNPPVHAWATWRVFQIDRKHTRRHRRPRVPRARVPQADAEFHLVGEPQGRRGPQRLPGRLPRARQHRRVRPQRAAAHGRPHRPGRRHQLDGDVLRST